MRQLRGRLVSAPDWRDLADAVQSVVDTGGRVPCREGGLEATRVWISNNPVEQRAAAAACAECAAFTMCREYAIANPLEAGVLGGLTEQDRKPKVGRPKKSEGVRTA